MLDLNQEKLAIEEFLYGKIEQPIFSNTLDKEHARKKRSYDRKYRAKMKHLLKYGNWRLFHEINGHIVVDSISTGRSSAAHCFKKISNKVVRQRKGMIPSGNTYRKEFDYWKEVN